MEIEELKKLVSEIVAESFAIGEITEDDLKSGKSLCNKDVESLKTIQDDAVKLEKMIENRGEKILPRPVVRDGNGKLIKDHTPKDFFLKLQEEIFEVMEAQAYLDYESTAANEEDVAEEIADIITVCISYLNANGYDEKARAELFAKVNEKNEKRGYFKEND